MKRNNPNDTHRTCTVCKQEKPITEFGKHLCMSDGIRSNCKTCSVKEAVAHSKKRPDLKTGRDKRYRESHKDKVNNLCRKHRNMPKNKERQRAYIRNWTLKKTYGITTEDYNNMFIEQAGQCAICGTHQSKLKKKLHVDHNHETGRVRGLLCDGCNIALGRMKDDMRILRSAIKYLEQDVPMYDETGQCSNTRLEDQNGS